MRLYVGNDQTLTVDGVQDAVNGDYINNATVTATLTRRGEPVAGENWPLTLQYVADSNGQYRANLDDAIDLSDGGRYVLEIRIEVSGGLVGFWRNELPANYRRF